MKRIIEKELIDLLQRDWDKTWRKGGKYEME